MSNWLYLAILAALVALGPLCIERVLRRSEPDPFEFTPTQQAAYDAHVVQALRTVAQAPVVPMQRGASE